MLKQRNKFFARKIIDLKPTKYRYEIKKFRIVFSIRNLVLGNIPLRPVILPGFSEKPALVMSAQPMCQIPCRICILTEYSPSFQ